MAYCTGRCMADPGVGGVFDAAAVTAMIHKVYAGRVQFHDGDEEIAPGISLHKVGGHTRGMQIVRVATARGWVVLGSDTAHFYANLEPGRPFPILDSLPAYIEAQRTALRLASSPAAFHSRARSAGAGSLPGCETGTRGRRPTRSRTSGLQGASDDWAPARRPRAARFHRRRSHGRRHGRASAGSRASGHGLRPGRSSPSPPAVRRRVARRLSGRGGVRRTYRVRQPAVAVGRARRRPWPERRVPWHDGPHLRRPLDLRAVRGGRDRRMPARARHPVTGRAGQWRRRRRASRDARDHGLGPSCGLRRGRTPARRCSAGSSMSANGRGSGRRSSSPTT